MKKVIVNNRHDRSPFLTDTLIFELVYVDHEQVSPEGIVNTINEEFLDKGEDGTWRKNLNRLDAADLRIVDFPLPTQGGFALIPLKISNHNPGDLTPYDVLNLLNDAYTEFGGDLIAPEGNNHEVVVGIDLGNGFRLRSISPNWLASDLHHGGNTGGPGSMPGSKQATVNQHKFRLRGKEPPPVTTLLQHKPQESSEGVQVAILDTAISLDDGVEINKDTELPPEHVYFSDELKILFTGETSDPGYPKMEVLLYPNSAELSECDPYAIWPHHYEMPDHGTFIASIVRAIAPSVKIYLYEVLNRFGVGSLVSIAQGVVNAVTQLVNTSTPVLVMNCSFMLDHDLEDLDLDFDDKWQNFKQPIRPEIKDALESSMRAVFNWVTEFNSTVVVVAAAGNDGRDENENRYPPRYPAAFNKVLSVAALPKGNPRHPHSNDPTDPNSRKYKPATYSNLAHLPGSGKEDRSFATFGGELVSNSSRPSNGVLGVYIGGIPTQNPNGTFNAGHANTTGWTHWSGTSFAAPIISALLAAKESELQLDNIDAPTLSDPPDSAKPYRTDENADENVILINPG